jgi:hypothetical protein
MREFRVSYGLAKNAVTKITPPKAAHYHRMLRASRRNCSDGLPWVCAGFPCSAVIWDRSLPSNAVEPDLNCFALASCLSRLLRFCTKTDHTVEVIGSNPMGELR